MLSRSAALASIRQCRTFPRLPRRAPTATLQPMPSRRPLKEVAGVLILRRSALSHSFRLRCFGMGSGRRCRSQARLQSHSDSLRRPCRHGRLWRRLRCAFDLIAGLLALREQVIPPATNIDNPIDGITVARHKTPAPLNNVLVLSSALGGQKQPPSSSKEPLNI